MAAGTCIACHRERTGYKKHLCEDCANPTKGWYRILALVSVLEYGSENAIGRADLLMKLRDASPPHIARRVPYTNSLTFTDIRRMVAEARKLSVPIASIDGRGYFLVGSEEDLRVANQEIDRGIAQLMEKKVAMRQALEQPSPLLQGKRQSQEVS